MPIVVWIKKLLLPPAGPIFLALGGWLVLLLAEAAEAADPRHLESLGLAAVGLGIGLLYLLSLPRVGFRLLQALELGDSRSSAASTEPGAIVVLDAGRYSRSAHLANPGLASPPLASPPLASDSVKPATLERLRHGARLARETGLPVLVSGNGAGATMADVLADDFGVETRWIEPDSRNTQENAFGSARLLGADGIDSVLLVTHAWHMPRAVRAFEKAGLKVAPSPMGFAGPDRWELRLLSFVPSIAALEASHLACHEWVGRAWYALRYR